MKGGLIMKMKSYVTFIILSAALALVAAGSRAETWKLDGRNLTVDDVVGIARNAEADVVLDEAARKNVTEGFDLVMEAAVQGKPVYGLTVGVGWKKDRPVFKMENGERVLNEELLNLSRDFNLMSLRAHGAGVGAPMQIDVVRAGMVVRLNQITTGQTGVQPKLAEMYRLFLNRRITPVVPSRGSVGEADITLASHIGLSMVGEWEVFYQGSRMPSADALRAADIVPLSPLGKDFLSILSTNALTAGHAALLADDVLEYLDKQAVVFALALEGFNGNVAPFLEETTSIRPFPGLLQGAEAIRTALDGSYLWEPAEDRTLQDPLSYRTMAYTLGSAYQALAELNEVLRVQINHSDDNPTVFVGEIDPDAPAQVKSYFIEGKVSGAIYPTANFEFLPVAERIERLNTALVRLSQAITMQTIRYENPALTKLSRFLSAEGNVGHSFGAIQKPLVALHTENRQIGAQAAVESFAMAGNIEDLHSNGPLAVAILERILDNIYWMSSIQMLHAAQAVDLRQPSALAKATRRVFDGYRAKVPFVEVDRIFSADFAEGYKYLRELSVTFTD